MASTNTSFSSDAPLEDMFSKFVIDKDNIIRGIHEDKEEAQKFWWNFTGIDEFEEKPSCSHRPFAESNFRELLFKCLEDALLCLLEHYKSVDEVIKNVQKFQSSCQAAENLRQKLSNLDLVDYFSTASECRNRLQTFFKMLQKPYMGRFYQSANSQFENLQRLFKTLAELLNEPEDREDYYKDLKRDISMRQPKSNRLFKLLSDNYTDISEVLEHMVLDDYCIWAEHFVKQLSKQDKISREIKDIVDKYPYLSDIKTWQEVESGIDTMPLCELQPTFKSTLEIATAYPKLKEAKREELLPNFQKLQELRAKKEQLSDPVLILKKLIDNLEVPKTCRDNQTGIAHLIVYPPNSTISPIVIQGSNEQDKYKASMIGLRGDLSFVFLDSELTEEYYKSTGNAANFRNIVLALQHEDDFNKLKVNLGIHTGMCRPTSWQELLDQLKRRSAIPTISKILISVNLEKTISAFTIDVKSGELSTQRSNDSLTIVPIQSTFAIIGNHKSVPLCFIVDAITDEYKGKMGQFRKLFQDQRANSSTIVMTPADISFSSFQHLLNNIDHCSRNQITTLVYHVSPTIWHNLNPKESKSFRALMLPFEYGHPHSSSSNGDLMVDTRKLFTQTEFDVCVLWRSAFFPALVDRLSDAPAKIFLVCQSHLMRLIELTEYSFNTDFTHAFSVDPSNLLGLRDEIYSKLFNRVWKGIRYITIRFHPTLTPHDIARFLGRLWKLANVVILVMYHPIIMLHLLAINKLKHLQQPLLGPINVDKYISEELLSHEPHEAVLALPSVPTSSFQFVFFPRETFDNVMELFSVSDSLCMKNPECLFDMSASSEIPSTESARFPILHSLRQARSIIATSRFPTIVVVEENSTLLEFACKREFGDQIYELDCRNELNIIPAVENFQLNVGKSVVMLKSAFLLAWHVKDKVRNKLVNLAKQQDNELNNNEKNSSICVTIVIQESSPDPRYYHWKDTALLRHGICPEEEDALFLLSMRNINFACDEAESAFRSNLKNVIILATRAKWLCGSKKPLEVSTESLVEVARFSDSAQYFYEDVFHDQTLSMMSLPDCYMFFHACKYSAGADVMKAVFSCTTFLDAICLIAITCVLHDSLEQILNFSDFVEQSPLCTFGSQRIRLLYFSSYLLQISFKENFSKEIFIHLCSLLKKATENESVHFSNTISFNALESFDQTKHLLSGKPAYTMQYTTQLSNITLDSLYESVVSDRLLDWNQLPLYWGTFPYGADVLAHITVASSYLLEILLCITPQGFSQILDSGIYHSTIVENELIKFPKNYLVMQLRTIERLMKELRNMSQRDPAAENFGIELSTNLNLLKWCFSLNGLIELSQCEFSSSDLKSIIFSLNIKDDHNFSPRMLSVCVSLDLDLSSQKTLEQRLIQLSHDDLCSMSESNIIIGYGLVRALVTYLETNDTPPDAQWDLQPVLALLMKNTKNHCLEINLPGCLEFSSQALAYLIKTAVEHENRNQPHSNVNEMPIWKSLDDVLRLLKVNMKRKSTMSTFYEYASEVIQYLPEITMQLHVASRLWQINNTNGMNSEEEQDLRCDPSWDLRRQDAMLCLRFIWSPNGNCARKLSERFHQLNECYKYWQDIRNGEPVFFLICKDILSDIGHENEQTISKLFDLLERLFPKNKTSAEIVTKILHAWLEKKCFPEKLDQHLELLSALWCLFPGCLMAPPMWLSGEIRTEKDKRKLLRCILDQAKSRKPFVHRFFEFANVTFRPRYANPYVLVAVEGSLQDDVVEPEALCCSSPLLVCHPHVGTMSYMSEELQGLLSSDDLKSIRDDLISTYNYCIESENMFDIFDVIPDDDQTYQTRLSLPITKGLTKLSFHHLCRTVLILAMVKQHIQDERLSPDFEIIGVINAHLRAVNLFMKCAGLTNEIITSCLFKGHANDSPPTTHIMDFMKEFNPSEIGEDVAITIFSGFPDCTSVSESKQYRAIDLQKQSCVINAQFVPNDNQNDSRNGPWFSHGILSYAATVDNICRFNFQCIPQVCRKIPYTDYRKFEREQRVDKLMKEVYQYYDDSNPYHLCAFLSCLQDMSEEDSTLATECLKSFSDGDPDKVLELYWMMIRLKMHNLLKVFTKGPSVNSGTATFGFDFSDIIRKLDQSRGFLQLRAQDASVISKDGYTEIKDVRNDSENTRRVKNNSLNFFANGSTSLTNYTEYFESDFSQSSFEATQSIQEIIPRAIQLLDAPCLLDVRELLYLEKHRSECSHGSELRYMEVKCLPGQDCFLLVDYNENFHRQTAAAPEHSNDVGFLGNFPAVHLKVVTSLLDYNSSCTVLASFDTFHEAWLYIDVHVGRYCIAVANGCVLSRTKSYQWSLDWYSEGVPSKISRIFDKLHKDLNEHLFSKSLAYILSIISEQEDALLFVKSFLKNYYEANFVKFADIQHNLDPETAKTVWERMMECLNPSYINILDIVISEDKSRFSLVKTLVESSDADLAGNSVKSFDLFKHRQDTPRSFEQGHTDVVLIAFPSPTLELNPNNEAEAQDRTSGMCNVSENKVQQWLLSVLVSPLLPSTKRGFVQLLHGQKQSEERLEANSVSSQDRVVGITLANCCPWPRKKVSLTNLIDITDGNQNFESLHRCLTRKDDVYGMFVCTACFEHLETVADGALQPYISKISFEDRLSDSEIFLRITNQFDSNCHIVYVEGLHDANDILLKWCCEFTERWPWRFIYFENLDLRFNFPEIRDRFIMLDNIATHKVFEENSWIREFMRYSDSNFPEYCHPNTNRSSNQKACWKEKVERLICQKSHCVILLSSPPGAGKSHFASLLMEKLSRGPEDVFCKRFDCSDDRLVTKNISVLLDQYFVKQSKAFLVADEFHLLSALQKEELFHWIRLNSTRVKVLLICNRILKVDDNLMNKLHLMTAQGHSQNMIIETIKIELTPTEIFKIASEDMGIAKNIAASLLRWTRFLRLLLGSDALSLRDIQSFTSGLEVIKENPSSLERSLLAKCPYLSKDFAKLATSMMVPTKEKQTSSFLESVLRYLIDCCSLNPTNFNEDQDVQQNLFDNNDEDFVETLQTFVEFSATSSGQQLPAQERCEKWLENCIQPHIENNCSDITWKKGIGLYTWVEQDPFPYIRLRKSSDQPGLAVGITGDYTDICWLHNSVIQSRPVNWTEAKKAWEKQPVTDLSKFEELLRDCPNKWLCLEALEPKILFNLAIRSDLQAAGPGLLLKHMAEVYSVSSLCTDESNTRENQIQRYFFTNWRSLLYSFISDQRDNLNAKWINETRKALMKSQSKLAALLAWASKHAQSFSPILCHRGGNDNHIHEIYERFFDFLADTCWELMSSESTPLNVSSVFQGCLSQAFDGCFSCPKRRAKMLPAVIEMYGKNNNMTNAFICDVWSILNCSHPDAFRDDITSLRDDNPGSEKFIEELKKLVRSVSRNDDRNRSLEKFAGCFKYFYNNCKHEEVYRKLIIALSDLWSKGNYD